MGLLFTLQFGVLVWIIPKRIKDLAFIDDGEKLLENSQNCEKKFLTEKPDLDYNTRNFPPVLF